MLYRKCRKTSIRWRRGSKRGNVVTAAEVVGGAAAGAGAGDNHPGTTYCAFTIKAIGIGAAYAFYSKVKICWTAIT